MRDCVRTLFIVGTAEGLPTIGWEKTISRRPVIPLFAFPGCSFVDQGLIQMTVQDLCPDRKRNISVSCKLLLEPQKTILPGISAAQDNLLLPLSLAPKMDSVA